jgi:hypothetical protein
MSGLRVSGLQANGVCYSDRGWSRNASEPSARGHQAWTWNFFKNVNFQIYQLNFIFYEQNFPVIIQKIMSRNNFIFLKFCTWIFYLKPSRVLRWLISVCSEAPFSPMKKLYLENREVGLVRDIIVSIFPIKSGAETFRKNFDVGKKFWKKTAKKLGRSVWKKWLKINIEINTSFGFFDT